MIELGKFVTDKITGFQGFAAGHATYLTGCSQILVTPKVDKDGKVQESHWFDEQRLIVDEIGEQVFIDNGTTPGGPSGGMKQAPKK